jgi:hypothetical protein
MAQIRNLRHSNRQRMSIAGLRSCHGHHIRRRNRKASELHVASHFEWHWMLEVDVTSDLARQFSVLFANTFSLLLQPAAKHLLRPGRAVLPPSLTEPDALLRSQHYPKQTNLCD